MTVPRPVDAAGLTDMDRLLKVLADPTRIRIVNLLASGELRVRELVNGLGLGQPFISRHLALLRRAGIVEVAGKNKLAPYRLAKPSNAMHHALMECIQRCCDSVEFLQAERRRVEMGRLSSRSTSSA